MRARIIKPGFYANEQLADCSLLARFIFPGLWMLADRRGRLEDRPKRIKATLLPYDDGNVDELLDELANAGLLTRFEAGGMRLIQILEFEKHQRCHVREPDSTLPSDPKAQPRQCLGDASTVPRHNLGECEASPICPEAEAEAEAEAEERVVVDAARARGSPRAVPLNAPTEAHEQLAREVGVSCQAEFEKFRDWLASTGTRPRDYSARFRNWLRKAGEFRARDAPRVTAHDKRTATAAAMYAHRTAPTHDDQPRDITGHAERLA